MDENKYYLSLLRKELVKEWRVENSENKFNYEALRPTVKDEYDELTEHINNNLLKNKRIKDKKNKDNKNEDKKRTWSIGESTIGRLFGYKDKDEWSCPDPTKLNQFAISLGYKSWGDFKSTMNERYCFLTPSIIEVFESQREEIRRLQEDMIRSKDDTYILGWYPEKYIKLKHSKNYTYEVLESKRMNRKEGDIFDAPDFCLSSTSTSEGSELPDIMIFDNIGYFDTHEEIPEL